MWIYSPHFYLRALKNLIFQTSEALKIFWGPKKRPNFWNLYLWVCLKKVGNGPGLYGKSVLYLVHTQFRPAIDNTSNFNSASLKINFRLYCVSHSRMCHRFFKVKVFWDGHKNLELSPIWCLLSKCQIKWVIAPIFFGLLRKAEL